jgi:hypothetical protein
MENIEMEYTKHKELFQKHPKYVISPELGKTKEDFKDKIHSVKDLLPDEYFFQDGDRYRTNFLPLLHRYKKYFYSDQSYVSLYYGVGEIKWSKYYCLNRFERSFKNLLEVHELSDHYYIFLHLLVDLINITKRFTDKKGIFNPLDMKQKALTDIKNFYKQIDLLKSIYNNLWPPINVKEENGEIIIESYGKDLKAITFEFEQEDLKYKKKITDPILITQFIEFGFQKEMLESFYLYKGRVVPALLKTKYFYTHLRKELTFMIYNYLVEETSIKPPGNQKFSAKIESFIVDYLEFSGLRFADKHSSSGFQTDKSINMNSVKSWIQSKIKQNLNSH